MNSPRSTKLVNCRAEYHHKPMPLSPLAIPLVTMKRPGPHCRQCCNACGENKDWKFSSPTAGRWAPLASAARGDCPPNRTKAAKATREVFKCVQDKAGQIRRAR